jgi:hypothetical protein
VHAPEKLSREHAQGASDARLGVRGSSGGNSGTARSDATRTQRTRMLLCCTLRPRDRASSCATVHGMASPRLLSLSLSVRLLSSQSEPRTLPRQRKRAPTTPPAMPAGGMQAVRQGAPTRAREQVRSGTARMVLESPRGMRGCCSLLRRQRRRRHAAAALTLQPRMPRARPCMLACIPALLCACASECRRRATLRQSGRLVRCWARERCAAAAAAAALQY